MVRRGAATRKASNPTARQLLNLDSVTASRLGLPPLVPPLASTVVPPDDVSLVNDNWIFR